jgi:hypothetical protein
MVYLSRPGHFAYYPASARKKTLYKEMPVLSRDIVAAFTGYNEDSGKLS